MRPVVFPEEKCCERCMFWKDFGDGEDAAPRRGWCCRFPPQQDNLSEVVDKFSSEQWVFPITGGHWCCGEFKAIEPTETKVQKDFSHLSPRLKNVLRSEGITNIVQLAAAKRSDLAAIPCFGHASFEEIAAVLGRRVKD